MVLVGKAAVGGATGRAARWTVKASGGAAAGAVLNASGYVTARRRATVSSKITGKVVEVNVEEGMAVREGQVLARLDDSTPRARSRWPRRRSERRASAVAENEVRLAEARADARRRRASCVQGQLVTQAEVDTRAGRGRFARRAHRRARASRSTSPSGRSTLQQTDLDNTVIRAPFSGVAISKDAQPGEMVSPVSAGGGFTRTGICTIVDMRSLEIEVDVNESYINRVRPGQQVDGRARRVSRLADPGARHHDRADGRSAEGDRAACASASRQARSAHPARHGRQGDVPATRADAAAAPRRAARVRVPKAAVRTDDGTTSCSS